MGTQPRPLRIPRISLANLLMLTVFVALVAVVIRWTGWLSIAVIYVFSPTIVGATCGLFEWPTRSTAMRVVRGTLIAVLVLAMLLPVSALLLLGLLGGIATTVALSALTLLLWLPQYMIVASEYD